jgi:hypothetical protein
MARFRLLPIRATLVRCSNPHDPVRDPAPKGPPAMSDYLEFDPAVVSKREVYRLLTGAVVPRPIGWASTVNKNGATNLAPFPSSRWCASSRR